MLKLHIRKRNVTAIAAGFIILALALVLSISSVLIRQASAADPVIIAVTTFVDEDADPGTGCSIYEASIAASTGAPYGGCSAGDVVNGSVIQLAAGTYVQTTEQVATRYIDLVNTSIVGQGTASTDLQLYAFRMSGSLPSSVQDLSMNIIADQPATNSIVSIEIDGSNKTIENVSSSYTDRSGSVIIGIAEAGTLVENTTIKSLTVTGESSTMLVCRSGGCDGVTLEDIAIDTTAGYIGFDSLDDATGVTVRNVSLEDPTGTVLFEVGANADIDGLTQVALGYAEIVTGSGSAVRNVSQIASGPTASVQVTGEADLVTDVTQDAYSTFFEVDAQEVTRVTSESRNYGGVKNNLSGAQLSFIELTSETGANLYIDVLAESLTDLTLETSANVYLNNYYDGGNFERVTISAGDHYITTSAETVSNFSINLSNVSGSNFYTNHSQAVISDIDIEATGTSGGVSFYANNAKSMTNFSYDATVSPFFFLLSNAPNFTADNIDVALRDSSMPTLVLMFNGSDATLKNSTFYSPSPAGDVNFTAANPTIENSRFVGRGLQLVGGGNAKIDRVSVEQGYPYGASINSPFQNVEITNSFFEPSPIASGAIGMNGGPLPNQRTIIDNVRVTGPGSSLPTAISTSGINGVEIRNTLIDTYAINSDRGMISIDGGVGHKISNTTIFNTNAGIRVSNPDMDTEVAVNNVTILNNQSGGVYEDAAYERGLDVIGSAENSTDVSVTNSIIAGTSPYVECSTQDASLMIENTYVSDGSCVGGQLIGILTSFIDDALADNSTLRGSIGYDGEQGKVQTLALPVVSLASAGGSVTTCENQDARGYAREGGVCASGAYQRVAAIVDDGSGQVPGVGVPNTGIGSLPFPLQAVIAIGGIALIGGAVVALRRALSSTH